MDNILLGMNAIGLLCAGAVGGVLAVVLARIGIRNLVAWIKANGEVLFYLAIAFMAGISIGLWWGGPHSDALFACIGAFAGIAVPIGGALWLWQMQEAKSAEKIETAVYISIYHILTDMIPVSGHMQAYAAGRYEKTAEWVVLSVAVEGREAISRYQYRRGLYELRLIELDAAHHYAHSECQRLLTWISSDLAKFVEDENSKTAERAEAIVTNIRALHFRARALVPVGKQLPMLPEPGINVVSLKLFPEAPPRRDNR